MSRHLIYVKPHNLPRLSDELVAGVPSLAPIMQPDGSRMAVFTLAGNGQTIAMDVPDTADEAGIAAVVAAHTNPPDPPSVMDYAGARPVEAIIRTTDDVVKEVFRLPTEVKHVYRATFQMTAIDAGNGTTKDAEARMTFKRTPAGLAQVGNNTTVLYLAQDTGAQQWTIQAGMTGTDYVIQVKGAAGRTIDWLLVGSIATYAPEGLH